MTSSPHSPIPPKNHRAHLVLVINPGSTSTKVGLYRGERCLAEKTVRRPAEHLKQFKTLADQAPTLDLAVLRKSGLRQPRKAVVRTRERATAEPVRPGLPLLSVNAA